MSEISYFTLLNKSDKIDVHIRTKNVRIRTYKL